LNKGAAGEEVLKLHKETEKRKAGNSVQGMAHAEGQERKKDGQWENRKTEKHASAGEGGKKVSAK